RPPLRPTNPTSGTSPLAAPLTAASSTVDCTMTPRAPGSALVPYTTLFRSSHSYATAGTYTASLTVTDDGGLTNTATVQITVNEPNAAPTAGIPANPTSGTPPPNVSLSGASSTDDGTITPYAWDFGDGSNGT